jgi:methylated-DNA-[protein]-cysteine S-methyltransferase
MDKIKYAFYSTKFGNVVIGFDDNYLLSVSFSDNLKYSFETTSFSDNVIKQLREYFDGKRTKFTIPLKFDNFTEFEQQVYKALIDIPYGEVRTYKDIAIAINHPKAYRAVGSANHKNPIPIIIPCHRVVACNSKLGGYAYGLEFKKRLLELENSNFLN